MNISYQGQLRIVCGGQTWTLKNNGTNDLFELLLRFLTRKQYTLKDLYIGGEYEDSENSTQSTGFLVAVAESVIQRGNNIPPVARLYANLYSNNIPSNIGTLKSFSLYSGNDLNKKQLASIEIGDNSPVADAINKIQRGRSAYLEWSMQFNNPVSTQDSNGTNIEGGINQ